MKTTTSLLLVLKHDFENNSNFSKNVEWKDIESHAFQAQKMVLKPVLGDSFYENIVNNNSNYKRLIDGCIYSYSFNGETISSHYEGIKKAIVYKTMALLPLCNGFTITTNGISRLKSNSTDKIDNVEIKRYSELYNQYADNEMNDLITYLRRSKEKYPLWVDSENINHSFTVKDLI